MLSATLWGPTTMAGQTPKRKDDSTKDILFFLLFHPACYYAFIFLFSSHLLFILFYFLVLLVRLEKKADYQSEVNSFVENGSIVGGMIIPWYVMSQVKETCQTRQIYSLSPIPYWAELVNKGGQLGKLAGSLESFTN